MTGESHNNVCWLTLLCAVGQTIAKYQRLRKERMPRFITIGYGDQTGYESTPVEIRNAAHAHDNELRQSGAIMGVAGKPVSVRNPDAKGIITESEPFMSSALPVAGFALIEAADISEAIRIVSKAPCAVAHGVVEVWPLEEK